MTVVRAGTIGDAVAAAAARLAAASITDERREARLLVALALGVDPAVVWSFPERPLDESARRRLEAFLARRAAREPLSRLRGAREFWSLDFALSPDTLDPRPDSETLIEAALELLPDRRAQLRVVDFGTGTGCLLLAFLSEFPNAVGAGVDIQPGAAAVARRNAATLGLERRAQFVVGTWDEAISGPADVILANPPYIPSKEIETLAPEVAHYEPRRALDGGPDGLAAYRILLSASRRLLVPGGLALFEAGAGQAEAVISLAVERGLRVRAVKRDLAGIDRCVAVSGP